MTKMAYFVNARWDADAAVYYSETNIPGLNIEAETLGQFFEAAQELAPQMLEANVPGFEAEVEHARPELKLAFA
jgi:hypothetical protein